MLLIQNARLKTMVGEDIENGSVLIDDNGKIAKVGTNIAPQDGVRVLDAEGRLLTPGLVEAHCHVGMRTYPYRWEGSETNENTDPLTPHLRAIDAINPNDKTFELARSHGVTTVCTGPGSANVVGGSFVALKTVGTRVDDMIVKYPLAMKCAFGENPKSVYGQAAKKTPLTRMAIAAMLRELLFKTQNYLRAKEAGKEPTFDMKLEAMIPVIKREIPLKAHAHRADDIFTAIRIAKEFDLLLTLDHCTEGELIAEDLAKEGYPALIGPSMGACGKPELINKSFSTAGALHKAGVPISIITDAGVTPIEHLAMCAGFAVSNGLPEEEAWRAITINPATQTGIADRVGSIEVGKDADLVLWDSNPLREIGVSAHTTLIEGKIVYTKEA